MHANTFRLKRYFLQKIHPGIDACIRAKDPISSAILICCAIDFLSKFFSGDPTNQFRKRKYCDFIQKYFPSYIPVDLFYNFVRCGLVHGYDMEGKYILINSNNTWARSLHLKYDLKHKSYIINPYVLKTDLETAFEHYFNDLLNSREMRKKLDMVYGKHPFRNQMLKSPKFKRVFQEGLYR